MSKVTNSDSFSNFDGNAFDWVGALSPALGATQWGPVGVTEALAVAASSSSSSSSNSSSSSSSRSTSSSGSSTPSWISKLSTASIAADMKAADVNGVVTEAGLTKLMTDLTSSLSSSNSKLTTAEFNDLKTIAANLNNGLSSSSYLTYVFDALVDGNAANAKFTGGASTSVTLGNLAAGATSTQLTDLTDKWLLGTDLPNDILNMSGYAAVKFKYSTVSSPLFGASGPSMSDVNQGYLGDCYFLSSCAEVADLNSSKISSMFTNNGNGAYGVRFYYDGQAEFVTVNAALPNGGTLFNKSSDIWASLAEKAYAQFQAINLETGNSVNDGNSYSTIGNGGSPLYALEALTGASAMQEYVGSGGSWACYTVNDAMTVTAYNTGDTTAKLMSALETDLSNHDDLILCSNTNAYVNGKQTLVADHAMSIYGYDASTGNLEIRNPWGAEAGQTWNTTFEVSLSALLSAGDDICVDNAGGTLASASSTTTAASTASSHLVAAIAAPVSACATSTPVIGAQLSAVMATLAAAA